MNFEKVYKSPINTSISKNLYSFSKAERFDRIRQLSCRNSYNVSGNLTARTTSFGLGNRTQLFNSNLLDNPSPGIYQTRPRNFNSAQGTRQRSGFTFGLESKIGFIDQTARKSARNPGPGTYGTGAKSVSSYTMSSSKYEDPLAKYKNKLGPGQYKVSESFNKTGSYFNSKHKNSGCGKIGNQRRFVDQPIKAPGPGKYQDVTRINRSGNYFTSKFRSNNVSNFERSPPRPSMVIKSDAPPPGSYYVFSQFGSRRNSSTNF